MAANSGRLDGPASPTEGGAPGSAGVPGTPDAKDEPAPPFVLRGAAVWGFDEVDIFVDAQGVLSFVERGAVVEAREIEAKGWTVLPGFVDSHVHLAYYDVRSSLPLGGVFAALDLAAPLRFLSEPAVPDLEIGWSGPMLTAPGGYPTLGWGRDGYGLELAGVEAARGRATELLDAGARVLKVPFAGDPTLSDEETGAIVEVAHERGRLVVTHAVSDAAAARARRLGCDVLAHTPTEPLASTTIDAWSGGAVLSTLVAFGDSVAARENLKSLRDGGARVLYGTDLGNHRTLGLSLPELEALRAAGLSTTEVIESATTAPSSFFGFEAGRFAPGKRARFVAVRGDPRMDLRILVDPHFVVVDGKTIVWKTE